MRQTIYIIAILVIVPRFALATESVKLPYAAGERFVVTTGYNTPPTHVKKDSYAIDFAQNGCDAYGKPAVAAFSGTAWVVEESGYNGGYGTELLILTGGNLVARYAHLIPGSIPVDSGDVIPQGSIIGEIGDTGLVAGTACAEHPGTHIHFAMDTENADGSFSAKAPEPISNYTGVTAGTWYVSDNALAATKDNLASLLEMLSSLMGSGVTMVSPSNPTKPAATPESKPTSPAIPTSLPAPISVPAIAASSSQTSSSRNIPNSSPTVITQATFSEANVPLGGGSGPVGGVSVAAASPVMSAATIASSTVPSADDFLDDTVSACE
jgi:hypothetical protein